MAFVFRGDRVDEETNMRATQRLYTLLPDHKCPQRDCPFHPPPEEETKEEDELPTEIVIKPQKSSAGVEEGGRLMAPPPPQPDEGYLPEMTIDLGEEMVLSDHDSVITGDSGVGREREDFSDGETGVFRPHSPSPSPPPLPLLQHIEEDEEVMTLTPESSTLGDSEVEQDSGDERDTPRTLTPPPEVEKEPQIRRVARDREMPGYIPLRLPVPEPTPPADFKLQAAPEFTAKLKNKRVPEGLSLHLHCSITGLPEPRVRWLKDGLEIKAGSGFTIKNNYGLLTLEVLTAGRHHGGVYGCQAYNQHGTVACDATVTIEGEEVVKTIQVEILRPRFLIPLHDLVVTEGEDVIMYCIATGKPLPSLKWQKDMLEVTTTSRVMVTTDGEGGSVLAIRKVKASDAGLYLVQAKSRSGRCKSTATLRVRAGSGRRASLPSLLHPHNAFCLATSITPKVKHDIPPSISLLLPPTLDVHEGDSLRLDCSVQGYPTPIVSWYKNHRGLRYGPRHRVLFVGSLHTLHIPQTMALDTGDYIVRAHNKWGSAESVCFVRLLPPRTSTDDISPAQPSLASPQPIKMAPFFTKALPSTVEVSEGGNFRLDCVTREGIQMVNWSQDTDTGQQPAASGPHDTGQPASQAASGSDSDTQNERTSKENTGEELQQGSKQFQQPLPEEVGVRLGESVTLTCTVSQPFTRIKWYKDDDRLSFDSARLESLREEGGRVLLRVDDTRQSDAGQYRCVASLPDGTQLQSHTRLSVLEQDEIQQKIDTRQTTPPVEMTSSVNTEKTPVLLLDHQRHVVGQGQKAKFKVTVEGSSPCTVTWSREGEPLKAGAKFKMYEEEGGHCLEVSEVSGEDRGTYHVTVTTQDGTKVTTSALLDIGEKEANDNNTKEPSSSTSSSTSTSTSPSQPPTLQSPLQDMDVVIGDRDVKLQCRVDVSEGSANSRVRWHHEGREVGEGEAGYRREWSGRVASLTLRQVTPQEAGLYRCVISSADGEVTTSCTLSVREPEKLEPPYFIKELRDLEVLDGDKVELIVEVEDTDLYAATHT